MDVFFVERNSVRVLRECTSESSKALIVRYRERVSRGNPVIIHFEGDHKVHVLKVAHDTLTEDKRFQLDFNTAFKTGPARPHGIAMK